MGPAIHRDLFIYLGHLLGILSITNPVGSLQIATGRTDIGFYWTMFRASITPAALLLGIYLGGTGVAYSLLALALGLPYPLWFVQIRAKIGVSFAGYFKEFYRPLLSFILLGFGLHWRTKPHEGPNFSLYVYVIASISCKLV